MTSVNLPFPREGQAFCSVSAIEAGQLSLPAHIVFDPRDVDSKSRWHVPSLAFLLHHNTRNEYLLFDLGIRKDYHNLPPASARWTKTFEPIYADPDIAEKIRVGGLDPSEVKYVVISHSHWDHTGDPRLFPNAVIIVSEGTHELSSKGYPADPEARVAQDLLPEGRTRVLFDDDEGWVPLGPFPRTLDLFGDGSIFVIDSPGHVSGHINLLARTSADGGWIYLAADSCHDYRLLNNTARMAMGTDENGVEVCKLHKDHAAAKLHIARIREVSTIPRVRMLLAHDLPWYEETKGIEGFWPRKIRSL